VRRSKAAAFGGGNLLAIKNICLEVLPFPHNNMLGLFFLKERITYE
jgi:hypothetical protein